MKCLGPWCSPDKAGLCCSCSLTDLGSQSAKEETGKIAKLEIRTQISKSKNLKGKVLEYQPQGVWSIGVLQLRGSFWDFRGPQRLSCDHILMGLNGETRRSLTEDAQGFLNCIASLLSLLLTTFHSFFMTSWYTLHIIPDADLILFPPSYHKYVFQI